MTSQTEKKKKNSAPLPPWRENKPLVLCSATIFTFAQRCGVGAAHVGMTRESQCKLHAIGFDQSSFSFALCRLWPINELWANFLYAPYLTLTHVALQLE